MLRRRGSEQMDPSWSDQFSMRPSIARMTLDVDNIIGDLGYDEMGMDEKTKQAHIASGRTEALQHRLTELLVFEIRQDGYVSCFLFG